MRQKYERGQARGTLGAAPFPVFPARSARSRTVRRIRHHPAGTSRRLMRDEITALRVPVAGHAGHSRDSDVASRIPFLSRSPSFPSFRETHLYVRIRVGGQMRARAFLSKRSVHQVERRCAARDLQKAAALNLERKAVLPGATSFKEEFSSYWRIFPGV